MHDDVVTQEKGGRLERELESIMTRMKSTERALPTSVKLLIKGYKSRYYWFEVFECARNICLLGLPIFFIAMYAMFFLTICVGGAFGELSAQLMELFINLLPSTSFIWVVVKSVGSGIAMCSSFVPILAVMFFCLAYMEQSGYLARVALLSDLLMKPIGLDGRSFIPLMLGFGCNVPAVSATRFIEGNEQRILTAMMVPFMACTARLSIFVVMASTFFSNSAPLLIMTLYLLSIMLAVVSALWFRSLLGMQVSQNAAITLPPYLKPSLSSNPPTKLDF